MTDGLLAPGRRPLTVGLLVTITLVASESLAIATVMPLVAAELGRLDLYGWAFSAFFLGALVGIVVVGGAIDRRGLRLPLAVGLGLFAAGLLVGGLAPSMEVLVIGRALQGLGPGPRRRSRTSRSGAACPRRCARGCSRPCPRRG